MLFLSHQPARRLIVFVHGFHGRAVHSWQTFASSAHVSAWWRESDMLFVGYDSVRENITGVAARLRREIPRFMPRLPPDLLMASDHVVRASAPAYQELILVGHSLGGLVLRRAVADAAQEWMDAGGPDGAPRPVILDAELRLFSPAIAGFRAAGRLGVARATAVWTALDMYLRRSSAYTELQPGSSLLMDTRRRTEDLSRRHGPALGVLKASILWANPDNVVLTERYDTDPVDDCADGTQHSSVCKPLGEYRTPWSFVQHGKA